MNNLTFLTVSCILTLTLLIGIIGGKKLKDLREFAVSHRNFSNLTILATIFATIVGGGTTLGIAERGYSVGLIYIVVEGLSFFINSFLIAYYIAPLISNYRTKISVGEIMGEHYGKEAQIITGIMATLISVGIVSVQVFSLSKLISYFMNISEVISTLIGYGIIVIYSVTGGIRSVIRTDIFQFALFIIIIPIIFNIGLDKVGGYAPLFQAMPDGHKSIITENNLFYIMMFFTFCLSLNPSIIQRLLIAKDVDQAKNSMKMTGIISIPFVIVVGLLGFVAYSLNPNLEPNTSLFFLIDTTLPSFIKGLAISALIAAIMSTADSDLNAASVSLTNDIISPLMKTLTAKQELMIVRIITVLMGFFSVYISLKFQRMVDIILYAYYFWAPTVLIPLILTMSGLRVKRHYFFYCTGVGIFVTLLWNFFLKEKTGFDGIIPGIIVNSALFFYGIFSNKTYKVSYKIILVSNFYRFYKNIIRKNNYLSPIFKFKFLANFSSSRVAKHGAQYKLFAIFGIINYIIPFFMWGTSNGNYYTTLFLRISASAVCFVLYEFASHKKYEKYLPLYWHFSLMYCLCFVTTYLLLENSGSLIWLVNMLLAIFLLLYLVDWLSFLLIFSLGVGVGWLIYWVINGGISLINNSEIIYLSFYMYFFAIIIGVTFSRRREQMIAEKEKSLKALAGTIAHEMRTPLASIYNASYLLNDYFKKLLPLFPASKYKSLGIKKDYIEILPEKIQKISRRSLSNIDILLGNIKNSREKIKLHSLSASEIVQEAIEDYPQDKSVSIKVCVEKDFTFYGESQFFKQVLYNLIKNAVFAVKKRDEDKDLPGKIEIILQIKKGQGVIILKDNGCGMTEMEKLKIFDKFFTTKDHGTGLGLTFCKNVIEAMRGTLKCQTQENKGTSFIIHFPIKS